MVLDCYLVGAELKLMLLYYLFAGGVHSTAISCGIPQVHGEGQIWSRDEREALLFGGAYAYSSWGMHC